MNSSGKLSKPAKAVKRIITCPVGKLLSDKQYYKIMYRIRLGKKPDFDSPKTFNEKLQWLKLNYRRDEFHTMADKYEAKKYVADIIGEKYVIPFLGVWNSFDEIDFGALPERFVLKPTHTSGDVVICRDKSALDLQDLRKKTDLWLQKDYYKASREWVYKDIKPRIIAEEFLENDGENGLVDYKFYCFDGKPEFLYISKGLENHATAQISFYDTELNRMPFKRNDFRGIEGDVQKPENFEEMLDIAAKLSAGFPFIRVDLYNLNGKIYFSELTFYPCSGYMPFDKPEWDEKIGAMLTLPPKKLQRSSRI